MDSAGETSFEMNGGIKINLFIITAPIIRGIKLSIKDLVFIIA